MTDVTWAIKHIEDLTGDITVEFTDEVNTTRTMFKWTGDKDGLIEHINQTAHSFKESWFPGPSLASNTKTELLATTGSSINYVNIETDSFFIQI